MISVSRFPKEKFFAFLIALLISLLTINLGIKLVDKGLYLLIFRDIPYYLCNIVGRILTLNFGGGNNYPFCNFYIYNLIDFFKPLINGFFRVGTFALAFALFFGTFDLIRKSVKEQDIDLYQKRVISFYRGNIRNKIICFLLIFILAFGTPFLIYQRTKTVRVFDSSIEYNFLNHTLSCKKITDNTFECSGRGFAITRITGKPFRYSFKENDTCITTKINDYRGPVCKAAVRKGLIKYK